MRSRTLRAALATLVISGMSIGAGACVAPDEAGVYVAAGPPTPPYEDVVVQPGPEYVWVPGYYAYAGGSYLWVSGTWRVPPSGYHRWVSAHWEHQNRGWHLVRGHWT